MKKHARRYGMKMVFFTLVFLLCFTPITFSEISNYTVQTNIPLNKTLTIYGEYDGGEDVVCSFFIFDTEDQNQVIVRLSDEYTNASGQFYSEYQITEPLFKRGIDYNAVSVCGTDKIGSVFYVEQKEDIFLGVSSDMILTDVAFWTNPENSLTVVLVLFFMVIIAFLAYSVFLDIKG